MDSAGPSSAYSSSSLSENSDSNDQNYQSLIYQIGNKKRIVHKTLYDEIIKLQQSVKLIIPKRAFQRLVIEILQQFNSELRIQSFALEALQEAAEMYLVQHFEDSQECTVHAKRATLMCRDMQLVRKLQNND